MYLKLSEINDPLPDNDFRYFTLLEGVINSIDKDSIVEIYRKPDKYSTRITPTNKAEVTHILDEILKFHTLLGIRVNLSKSIKTTGKIFFDIVVHMQ